MVCFQSYVPQSMVKRDLFWGFFLFGKPKRLLCGEGIWQIYQVHLKLMDSSSRSKSWSP